MSAQLELKGNRTREADTNSESATLGFGINEAGSAVVEFVILAIPLFLPIFIFLAQFAEVSDMEIKGRAIVREVVRAYVSSEDASNAERRASLVLNYAAVRLGLADSDISKMRLNFSCSASPCLTPGGRVRAELQLELPRTHRQVKVSAQEYVSPWQ